MIKLVLLVGKGDSSKIIYNELKKYFQILAVIEENKPAPKTLLKRRIEKLGWLTVMGQIAFMAYLRILKISSAKRIKQIKADADLQTLTYPENIYIHSETINNEFVLNKLTELNPDIIIVNGTRIINQEILSIIPKPFINIHAGITPRYRGVHGGYWALAEKNASQCGVTVHLVDEGIDTGAVLKQAIIKITKKDNFLTYPYLQIAASLPILNEAINEVHSGKYEIINNKLSSHYYSHPTLFKYVKNFIRNRVK